MSNISSIQYRFSGYQLPLIQLDSTGPAYIVIEPHPFYYNQPQPQESSYKSFTGVNIPQEQVTENTENTRLYKMNPLP